MTSPKFLIMMGMTIYASSNGCSTDNEDDIMENVEGEIADEDEESDHRVGNGNNSL